jgi:hypothetical protein
MTTATLPSAIPQVNPTIQPAWSSAERRKADLVDLANFGARTGRKWLVRDALLAMYSEGLMTAELAHIVPTALIEDPAPYIAEALHRDEVWIVADAYDAVRLESYGFPALATEGLTALTLDHLSGAPWVILLQRPGEERTLAGLDVRGELLRLGWSGMLTSIILPFIDLDVAEAECGERFAVFLAALVSGGSSQVLSGAPQTDREFLTNGELLGGLRTIAASEVLSWRR